MRRRRAKRNPSTSKKVWGWGLLAVGTYVALFHSTLLGAAGAIGGTVLLLSK